MLTLVLPCLALVAHFETKSLDIPVQLFAKGIPQGTRIAFTLNCRLEARDYLGASLSGGGKAAPILGAAGPWKEDFLIQAGLDSQQGRAPFVFHLPSVESSITPPGTLLTAVFELSYEYHAPGKPVFKNAIRLTRINPKRASAPLALHFMTHGSLPDGSPNVVIGIFPLGTPLEKLD